MKTLFPNNAIYINTSNISIENRLEALSLEAVNVANVIEVFKGILPDLTVKITETLDKLNFYLLVYLKVLKVI